MKYLALGVGLVFCAILVMTSYPGARAVTAVQSTNVVTTSEATKTLKVREDNHGVNDIPETNVVANSEAQQTSKPLHFDNLHLRPQVK